MGQQQEQPETPLKDTEIAFTRKRDGQIVNVKLFEIFKKFKTADFLNNEIVLDGEVLIVDSFRKAYYEVRLSVVKNSINGGNGVYQVNGVTYDSNHSFAVEKETKVYVTIIANQGSIIESVMDEEGNNYDVKENVVTVYMAKDHTLTINFGIQP